jgi:hypothetical protein
MEERKGEVVVAKRKVKDEKVTALAKRKDIPEEWKRNDPVRAPRVRETSEMSINPHALIAAAIQKGLPMEQLQRLLDMRRELEAERAKKLFLTALSGFQAACPVIEKRRVVHEKNSQEVRYVYAPIEAIAKVVSPILKDFGLSVTALPEQQLEGWVGVSYQVHHEGGHTGAPVGFRVPIDAKAYMSAPQKVAAALTFARRYAFCLALNIVLGGEDNDANWEDDAPPAISEPQAKAGTTVNKEGVATARPAVIPLSRARAELQVTLDKMEASKLYSEKELGLYLKQGQEYANDAAKLADIRIDWESELASRKADKGR